MVCTFRYDEPVYTYNAVGIIYDQCSGAVVSTIAPTGSGDENKEKLTSNERFQRWKRDQYWKKKSEEERKKLLTSQLKPRAMLSLPAISPLPSSLPAPTDIVSRGLVIPIDAFLQVQSLIDQDRREKEILIFKPHAQAMAETLRFDQEKAMLDISDDAAFLLLMAW